MGKYVCLGGGGTYLEGGGVWFNKSELLTVFTQ